MRDNIIELYLLMHKIRKFEERVAKLFDNGDLKGTTHLSIGQESNAVGVCQALDMKDLIVSTHRGHGHYIAKGGDINKLMAEFFGKKTGLCGGRGGSQHIFDMDIGFLGANGITGGGMPISLGAAFSVKYKQQSNIVVVFIGDGASNQGTFHEVMNMASVWNLPLLVIVENNRYAMFTHHRKTTSVDDISIRAKAYGLESQTIVHEDVAYIQKRTQEIKKYILEKKSPYLLEIKTFRLCGHSKSDDCSYMPKEELESYIQRDPLKCTRRRIVSDEIISEEELLAAETRINHEIEDAVLFAKGSEKPTH